MVIASVTRGNGSTQGAIYSEDAFNEMNGVPHTLAQGEVRQIGPVWNNVIHYVYAAENWADAQRFIQMSTTLPDPSDFAIQPTPGTHKPGWQIVQLTNGHIRGTWKTQWEAREALRRFLTKPDPLIGWTFTLGARRTP